MSLPVIPPQFQLYLKGVIHSLYQQGHDEQGAHAELKKFTGEEFVSLETVNEYYKTLKEGRYLINIKADDLKILDEKPPGDNRWWISRMTSWAFGGYSMVKEPIISTYWLRPLARNASIVKKLEILIGKDFFEVSVDEAKRRYQKSGSDCLLICGDTTITMRDKTYLEAGADYFKELLGTQDLRIEKWLIHPFDETLEEDPQFAKPHFDFHEMMRSVLSSIGHYQRVESFDLIHDRIHRNMCYLPYFQPRVLRNIGMHNWDREVLHEDEEVFETEQFKSAEQLICGLILYDWWIFFKKFSHFKRCHVQTSYFVNFEMYYVLCKKLQENQNLEVMRVVVGSKPEHIEDIVKSCWRVEDTPNGPVRLWMDSDGDMSDSRKMDINIYKNELVFFGRKYPAERMACYVNSSPEEKS